jgi:RHS repeat-associated protein
MTSDSNTVSVTITGATDSIKLTAASFTGAHQSSPLDASNVATGFGGNPTASVTGLNYMGARYYAGNKARFLSEDPVFVNLGVVCRDSIVWKLLFRRRNSRYSH